jgi:hypothetical protein
MSTATRISASATFEARSMPSRRCPREILHTADGFALAGRYGQPEQRQPPGGGEAPDHGAIGGRLQHDVEGGARVLDRAADQRLHRRVAAAGVDKLDVEAFSGEVTLGARHFIGDDAQELTAEGKTDARESGRRPGRAGRQCQAARHGEQTFHRRSAIAATGQWKWFGSTTASDRDRAGQVRFGGFAAAHRGCFEVCVVYQRRNLAGVRERGYRQDLARYTEEIFFATSTSRSVTRPPTS